LFRWLLGCRYLRLTCRAPGFKAQQTLCPVNWPGGTSARAYTYCYPEIIAACKRVGTLTVDQYFGLCGDSIRTQR
jgi:hypothetical protein